MSSVVVMISRGLCPPTVVVDAIKATFPTSTPFVVLEGMPRVEAKQAAVNVAIESESDLILIEDDVKLSDQQWEELLDGGEEVLYADGRCRDGSPSFRTAKNGHFIGGTMAVRLPLSILVSLDPPVFESRWIYFDEDEGTWEDRGPIDGDRHSDIVLWYKLHHLDPIPDMRSLGMASHLKHPLNDGSYAHDGPVIVGEF